PYTLSLHDALPISRTLPALLEFPDSFRCPLEHAHQHVELPSAWDGAADHAAEHDLRARELVDRVIGRSHEVGKGRMEFLLLQARHRARDLARARRAEQPVQDDGRG